MKTLLNILPLLLSCSVNATDDKTPFGGTWERVENEMTRWKFSGNISEVYWELDNAYYKYTFIYKEISPNTGMIMFDQIHSTATNGEWNPDKNDIELTNYKLIDSTMLEITSYFSQLS
jgi:hypothetical protein